MNPHTYRAVGRQRVGFRPTYKFDEYVYLFLYLSHYATGIAAHG